MSDVDKDTATTAAKPSRTFKKVDSDNGAMAPVIDDGLEADSPPHMNVAQMSPEQQAEMEEAKRAIEGYHYDESILKRRKKKLQGNGVSVSVPKKGLTAYAIFVKTVTPLTLETTRAAAGRGLRQEPRHDEGTGPDVEQPVKASTRCLRRIRQARQAALPA